MQKSGDTLGGDELEEAMEPDPPISRTHPSIEIIEHPPEEGVEVVRLKSILEHAKQQTAPLPPTRPRGPAAPPHPAAPQSPPAQSPHQPSILEDFQRKWEGPEIWFDNSSKWKHPDTPLHYDDCWEVIRAMFKERGFVHHQTGSWNAFLHRLPTILEVKEALARI